MAEEAEETYGSYKTKLTTIKHSAVASWSGFGYQGQCAMLYALKLLSVDRDKVKDYYLSLESYEDFAILDATERIVSLHQCKCYSKPVDFTDECHKISDKREYYSKQLHKCDENVPCFFLSNITPTKELTCGVQAYEFQPGQTTCAADKVIEQIERAIKEYMIKYDCARSEEAKVCLLTNMIEDNVARMHQKKNDLNADCWQIATSKDSWIPFRSIIAELEKQDDIIKTDSLRAITARNAINTHLSNCLDGDGNDPDFYNKKLVVNRFLDRLNGLDIDSLKIVVRRMHPQVDWNENCTVELRGSEKGNTLYRVLTSTQELNDIGNLSWNDGGILSTPSTVGQDRKTIRYAEIIRKSPVLAFLSDYRWIVGHVDETICNILEEAPKMTDLDSPVAVERITRPSKLGLLSIDDKNTQDYVKNHS